MTVYRRRKHRDAWHWCRNCTYWPKSNYVAQGKPGKTRPTTGELCNQCRSKERKKTCS